MVSFWRAFSRPFAMLIVPVTLSGALMLQPPPALAAGTGLASLAAAAVRTVAGSGSSAQPNDGDVVQQRREAQAKVSGPFCAEGAVVHATVEIVKAQGRRHRLRMKLHTRNACVSNGIDPSAQFAVLGEGGRVVGTYVLDGQSIPGRGWPWNGDTSRDDASEVELTNGEKITGVRVRILNRGHRDSKELDAALALAPFVVSLF